MIFLNKMKTYRKKNSLVKNWIINIFNNVKINGIINEDVNKDLSEINFTMNKIQNRIYIKKLLNQAFKSYSG